MTIGVMEPWEGECDSSEAIKCKHKFNQEILDFFESKNIDSSDVIKAARKGRFPQITIKLDFGDKESSLCSIRYEKKPGENYSDLGFSEYEQEATP